MLKPIYLDYAAATPVKPKVLEAMKPYYTEKFYNPSALYKPAVSVKNDLEEARSTVAKSIGVKPSEIIFVSGGTESDNLAINGVMSQFPDKKILISSIEHEAVRRPAGNYKFVEIPVDKTGRVEIDRLKKLIDKDIVMISIMYANNEVGTLQPIIEIAQIIQEVRKSRGKSGNKTPLIFHTDACQAPLYLDVNAPRLGVDMMTLNGGKIFGPKQSGILYVKAGTILSPQIKGGGQEFGYRSGTENVAQAIGFATALQLAVKRKNSVSKKVLEIKKYFVEKLLQNFDVEINGSKKHSLPNNISTTFAGTDNERMLFSLDNQGVFAATGSACSASSDESSHTLLAMGLSEEQARSTLRFSLSELNTKEEIDRVIKALKIALKA